jgi:hypothetical protein
VIERDREAFAAQITYLAEAFAERMSPVRIGAYFDALNGYEIEFIRGAVEQCIKNSRFFPKPAEILEECGRLRGAWRRALADQSRLALPAPVAAGDEDLCTEIDGDSACLETVAAHRKQFAELVAKINTPENWARLRMRPSLLERRGIHPPRPGVVITPEEDLR